MIMDKLGNSKEWYPRSENEQEDQIFTTCCNVI